MRRTVRRAGADVFDRLSHAGVRRNAYARLVARHFSTEHEEFRVRARRAGILPKLVWHYDEPFADSSAVPTWYLAELTRQRVTVALTGDGGDELFAGYPRYRAVWLADWFDRLPRAVAAAASARRFWQQLAGGAGGRSRSLRRCEAVCRSAGLAAAAALSGVDRDLQRSPAGGAL